ncbi:MAG: phosphohistidine phosphatase SixA [Proteobacteria bacterium]|nr:phosphohistidine phosphatase SixA [Pseudomonadota bacterium]
MKLYLVRHGEAYSNEERFERPLNPRGQNEVLQIANFLKNDHCMVDKIYHSEKLRAIETAEIIANTLDLTNKLQMLPSLDPDEDVYKLIGDIHEFTQNILMVGHLPNLALLASFMINGNITTPSLSFLTATTACFELDNSAWKLKWSIDPQSLRKSVK